MHVLDTDTGGVVNDFVKIFCEGGYDLVANKVEAVRVSRQFCVHYCVCTWELEVAPRHGEGQAPVLCYIVDTAIGAGFAGNGGGTIYFWPIVRLVVRRSGAP